MVVVLVHFERGFDLLQKNFSSEFAQMFTNTFQRVDF